MVHAALKWHLWARCYDVGTCERHMVALMWLNHKNNNVRQLHLETAEAITLAG